MKDRQVHITGPQPRIPIISSVLHWLAMPVIVLLRSGFGFSFLSPKSVFLACSWAAILFGIYAWHEPDALQRYWALASFGAASALAYILHLVIAFSKEVAKRGEHDFHAGTSHLLRTPGTGALRSLDWIESGIHLWVEPLAAIAGSVALQAIAGEQTLSRWLLVAAAAMWLKEFLNYWYQLRHMKKQADVFSDAEETMEGNPSAMEMEAPSGKGRRVRERRRRETNDDQKSSGQI